ncbi:MAG: FAD:protein FMN transferase [Bacteroidota bacterium]
MNRKALLIFGLSLIVAFVLVSIFRKDASLKVQQFSGTTMGSIVYHVKYLGEEGAAGISDTDSVLIAFNQSLSTYIPDSEISRLNNLGKVKLISPFFLPVLEASQEVFQKTGGAFDPTVGPLINAWGYGPEKQLPEVDSAMVDSLRKYVGFDLVQFDSSSVSLLKNQKIDFSAIAKGYAVDLVGELLEKKGIENYLVEIGGEVRCRGINQEGKSWSLGIEDPTVAIDQQELLAIVRIKDLSLATSGNYRNYYEQDGKTYAHIIDPRTGYTSQHNLLSASVFAKDCMIADAYATAFMVVGLEASKSIVDNESVEAILIYQDQTGELKSFVSPGIKPFVELNKTK